MGSTVPKQSSILPKRELIIPKWTSTLPIRGSIIAKRGSIIPKWGSINSKWGSILPKRGSIIAFMKVWSTSCWRQLPWWITWKYLVKPFPRSHWTVLWKLWHNKKQTLRKFIIKTPQKTASLTYFTNHGVGLTAHNVERKHHLFIDLLFSSRFQIPLVSTIPRSVFFLNGIRLSFFVSNSPQL